MEILEFSYRKPVKLRFKIGDLVYFGGALGKVVGAYDDKSYTIEFDNGVCVPCVESDLEEYEYGLY